MRAVQITIMSVALIGVPNVANSILFSSEDETQISHEIVDNLVQLGEITEFVVPDDLSVKFNQVISKFDEANNAEPGTSDAQRKVKLANIAYRDFTSEFAAQFRDVKKTLDDEQFDEIFELINWDADAFSRCVDYQSELLDLFRSNRPAILEYREGPRTLDDDLYECEKRLELATEKIRKVMRQLEEEEKELEQRLAEFKNRHKEAKEANDHALARKLEAEIKTLKDEEIPEVKRKLKKTRAVERQFDLLSFLGGLLKMVLGTVTLIVGGAATCAADAAKEPDGAEPAADGPSSAEPGADARDGACEATIKAGVALIGAGISDIVNAFDRPDDVEHYEETIREPAKRPVAIVQQEKKIKDALENEETKLCCRLFQERRKIQRIPTDEEGPLSFGFTKDEDGLVSELVMINNADGQVLAEISDSRLFFAHGPEISRISTKKFEGFEKAKTVRTDDGNHIVVFSGTLKGGRRGMLGVIVSPQTFSGKFKVAFRSLPN